MTNERTEEVADAMDMAATFRRAFARNDDAVIEADARNVVTLADEIDRLMEDCTVNYNQRVSLTAELSRQQGVIHETEIARDHWKNCATLWSQERDRLAGALREADRLMALSTYDDVNNDVHGVSCDTYYEQRAAWYAALDSLESKATSTGGDDVERSSRTAGAEGTAATPPVVSQEAAGVSVERFKALGRPGHRGLHSSNASSQATTIDWHPTKTRF